MGYRVVQWNAGTVDTYALRGIINHAGLELAGLGVTNDVEAGADAGTIAGTAPVGVAASRDLDELLARIPDCVHYAAAPDQPLEAVRDDLVRILRSGASVVTSTLPLGPEEQDADALRELLRAAADEGAATLFTPGTTMGIAGAMAPGPSPTHAAALIDTIPAVCRARPGLLTPRDLPPATPLSDRG